MSDFLSDRVKQLQPSPTLAVTQKAAELRAAGQDIIGLGAGEPDFDTPDNIKEAAIRAIREGQTKYTAVDGTAELKQAVIDKFKRDNGLDYAPNQILVSTGAKQSLFNLCQAVVNPGDEVIIPAPYWVSYPAMVEIAGGKPVFVTADWDQDYKITPEQLEAAISDKTRLVMLNSPSNPTGLAYTREEFQALAEVLKKHPQLLIATDDMYEHILWTDEPFVTLLNVAPELYERTVVFNGVSKAYAMTGWRIGYAGGPEKIIGAMKKVQGQSTSNPASISQAAATEALAGDQSKVAEMVKAFKERHDQVYQLLSEIPGVRVKPSMGTFYTFPDFREAIAALDGINSDTELAEFLLKEAGVALVPGSAFGLAGHMRLSYATDMATLEDACARIRKALAG
ncbi:pyridoxal phosphate-dependent aminotransferase [Natronospira bacteriovora]|uniref:Aminotransferase n=1 Tax=Natronospira bacteriovora TaxID=3069753 RepID=A0ABU0W5A6_9GAMM|nr:pyridoxal phosphate-dependent aminotransferase [Natronospira sp. AB-CW4]MDQ2069206.1 pyridoxal phosphate-dependent aminotransferase [Natronospira sp. AB-CW4]